MSDSASLNTTITDRPNLLLERLKKLLYNQTNCVCVDAKVSTVKPVTGGMLLNVTLKGDDSAAKVVVSTAMLNYGMIINSVTKGCNIRIFGELISQMREDEPALQAHEITSL